MYVVRVTKSAKTRHNGGARETSQRKSCFLYLEILSEVWPGKYEFVIDIEKQQAQKKVGTFSF